VLLLALLVLDVLLLLRSMLLLLLYAALTAVYCFLSVTLVLALVVCCSQSSTKLLQCTLNQSAKRLSKHLPGADLGQHSSRLFRCDSADYTPGAGAGWQNSQVA